MISTCEKVWRQESENCSNKARVVTTPKSAARTIGFYESNFSLLYHDHPHFIPSPYRPVKTRQAWTPLCNPKNTHSHLVQRSSFWYSRHLKMPWEASQLSKKGKEEEKRKDIKRVDYGTLLSGDDSLSSVPQNYNNSNNSNPDVTRRGIKSRNLHRKQVYRSTIEPLSPPITPENPSSRSPSVPMCQMFQPEPSSKVVTKEI